MTTYAEVTKRLLSFENRHFGSGASDDEIAAAERTLGVPIQGSYRLFLKQFGWGGVEHLELYGLGFDVPPYLNVIRITQSERHEMEPRLKRHLVPVMNDGGGNLYCIDTSMVNEPPIVFWDHTMGPDQKLDIDAEDYSSWLAE